MSKWLGRVWSNVIVVLGFVVGALCLVLLLMIFGVFGFDEPASIQESKRLTGMAADFAVVLTAIGVLTEYLRKRRKARRQLSPLDTVQADVATERDRLNPLTSRVEALEGKAE